MKNLITLLTFLFLITIPALLLAQPGLPSNPEQTPLGGIELLATAVGAYAIKKLREKKK